MKQRDFYIAKKDHYWARIRACGIILNNDAVLMITNKKIDHFYSIGGAVHIGETTEDACVREVFEETGVRFEIDRLLYIHENFFASAMYGSCHEIAFYYLMKVDFRYNLNCKSKGINGERESLEWIPLDRYHEYNAYPEFFGDKLKNLSQGIEHIISR